MRYDGEESEAMKMKRILETGRLVLREMTPDDFDALYAVLPKALPRLHSANENKIWVWQPT